MEAWLANVAAGIVSGIIGGALLAAAARLLRGLRPAPTAVPPVRTVYRGGPATPRPRPPRPKPPPSAETPGDSTSDGAEDERVGTQYPGAEQPRPIAVPSESGPLPGLYGAPAPAPRRTSRRRLARRGVVGVVLVVGGVLALTVPFLLTGATDAGIDTGPVDSGTWFVIASQIVAVLVAGYLSFRKVSGAIRRTMLQDRLAK